MNSGDWWYSAMALNLRNRIWYPVIFVILFVAVIVGWWIFPEVHRPELLVAGIGGAAGFTYFLYRQHLDRTTLFKELFTDFNDRYDKLNDHLHAILSPTHGKSLSPEEKEHVFSYFDLCAEEYFFYRVGYVDRDVWKSWYRGMEEFFKDPLIRRLWEEDSESDSYYGFHPPPHDPHPRSDRISRTPRS
jgi:hypothetical protein